MGGFNSGTRPGDARPKKRVLLELNPDLLERLDAACERERLPRWRIVERWLRRMPMSKGVSDERE